LFVLNIFWCALADLAGNQFAANIFVRGRGLSDQRPHPPSTPQYCTHTSYPTTPHTHTLPPIRYNLTPDFSPTRHTSIPGRQPHVRTFQDHAESISCNPGLNSGGNDQRGTRTDLKYMQNYGRQTRARVTRGGGSNTTCPCE